MPRGLYTLLRLPSGDLPLKDWPRYCCGTGGTGGIEDVRGVLEKFRPAVAAARAPSSVPAVEGRKSLTPESLCGGNEGDTTLSAYEL